MASSSATKGFSGEIHRRTRKKTEQDIALLKEFLTLKGESRTVEEIAQDELNSFIITVRKKDDNEDCEPIHCVVC